MSTIAINPIHRVVRFYEAPIGKKVIMAFTGVILFGYVVAHLLGNLQIFLPPADNGEYQINHYAAFLHSSGNVALLTAARLFLLICVGMHILASVQLWRLKREARPVAYKKKDDASASYASRTMMWSGPIIAAFVIFHVLHLTVGAVGPTPAAELGINSPDVRANVIHGFQNPAISAFYIFAMILLCMHLYHGLWSMFQSLGISHPRYTPILKKGAAIFAILIAIGNCSIPIAVMAGLVK
ncbi:MAG: succinate dehydrogenase subunit [Candidatus Solibacter sp.]|nr:succinate dehydrogenase subunit [Candidatus Solibacter sp.]